MRRSRTPIARAGAVAEAVAPVGLSYGRLAWQAGGWAVGLSLLYLLLTNTEHAPAGSSAVELLAKGLTRTVDVVISPLADPLSPNRQQTRAAPTSAAGVPILQPGESNAHFDQRMNDYLLSRAKPDTSVGAVLQGTTRPLGGFPSTRSTTP